MLLRMLKDAQSNFALVEQMAVKGFVTQKLHYIQFLLVAVKKMERKESNFLKGRPQILADMSGFQSTDQE